jgi:hypothetical protein
MRLEPRDWVLMKNQNVSQPVQDNVTVAKLVEEENQTAIKEFMSINHHLDLFFFQLKSAVVTVPTH